MSPALERMSAGEHGPDWLQVDASYQELCRRIEALEREFDLRIQEHEMHFRRIYRILEDLLNPPEPVNASALSPRINVGRGVRMLPVRIVPWPPLENCACRTSGN